MEAPVLDEGDGGEALAAKPQGAWADDQRIGRPSKFERHEDELREMIKEDALKTEMKRRTGLTYATVSKYVERIKQEVAEQE